MVCGGSVRTEERNGDEEGVGGVWVGGLRGVEVANSGRVVRLA